MKGESVCACFDSSRPCCLSIDEEWLVFLPIVYLVSCSLVVYDRLKLLEPSRMFFLAKLDLSNQEYMEGLLDDTLTNVMAESFMGFFSSF